MDSIFSVENEHLKKLSPERAVEVFRDLLWAECRRLGVGIEQVQISLRTDVSDGGVDARIAEGHGRSESGLVRDGLTSFQIKTGATFEPHQKSHIKKELFGKGAVDKDALGEMVKDCLDNEGRYVLVTFGKDLTSLEHDRAKQHLSSLLGECGYTSPRIEVWGQTQIRGFLGTYPSLQLEVSGRRHLQFQTHRSWSEDDDMRKDFVEGEKQVAKIGQVRSELRRSDDAVHIRISGEPGVGKTKLVLEATREEDLRPLVVYCDSASQFIGSELMNELLRDDNEYTVIAVIDECNPESRYYIWSKLKHRGSRMKLITIYSEVDEISGNTAQIIVPALTDEEITNIIGSYVTAERESARWAEFCEGSPRVAHAVGQNLIANPENILRQPDTVDLWRRFISGREDVAGDEFKDRLLVLRCIALFKRFGCEGDHIGEAKAIQTLAQGIDAEITWGRFQEVVNALRRRRILQGESTLYITPKLLHIWLWVGWWEVYGSGFDIEDFLRKLPAKLREWFFEMFKYAAESEVAKRLVENILGAEGMFGDAGSLESGLGASFFLALSEASPEHALGYLERTVGKRTREELLEFKTGRRETIWALERIAMWRKLFPGAARLLLQLGEAENEKWSNNASGVFADLFSSAFGPVSPTQASLEERFPILKEALESDSANRRLLGIRACETALSTGGGSRMVGAEYQGLKEVPDRWMPKTWGEIFDYYREVWVYLKDRIHNLPAEEQKEAARVFLRSSRGLTRRKPLAEMVIETLRDLVKEGLVPVKEVVKETAEVLRYETKGLDEETRKRWEELRNELCGSGFSSQLRRYAGMDLLEDKFDEEGRYADQTQPKLRELAEQAIANPKDLEGELPWLVTYEAENGMRFGYELGKRDGKKRLLQALLGAQRRSGENGSFFFVAGYFRAVRERNTEEWEDEVCMIASDPELRMGVPEIVWRNGLTERTGELLLELTRDGQVDAKELGVFRLGAVVRQLDERLFQGWLDPLLEKQDHECLVVALELFHTYYFAKENKAKLPEKLALELLVNPLWSEPSESRTRWQMVEYYWKEVGMRFVEEYPEEAVGVGEHILKLVGKDGTIFDRFSGEPLHVLEKVLGEFPEEMWKRISRVICEERSSRAVSVGFWLRGDGFLRGRKESIVELVPPEVLWEWVNEDVENRAKCLADIVPNELVIGEGKVCLARELLERYGDREDVRRALFMNFGSEGWSGPGSVHYENKRKALLEAKKGETSTNVTSWIEEYVASLDKRIEESRLQEERDEF